MMLKFHNYDFSCIYNLCYFIIIITSQEHCTDNEMCLIIDVIKNKRLNINNN